MEEPSPQETPDTPQRANASLSQSLTPDKEIVKVRLDTARPLIFDDVVVRVSEKFALAMHIDTDEANAVLAPAGVMGIILD